MPAFRYSDLRHIPRGLLERLEVCPAGISGNVLVWCIWPPTDAQRIEEVRAALRPYLPNAAFEMVQAIQSPGVDPHAWLAKLLDHVYGEPPTPTTLPSCSSCGQAGRAVIEGTSASLCEACCVLAAAAPKHAGRCDLCRRDDEVHAMAPVSACDACLELAGEIFRRGDR